MDGVKRKRRIRFIAACAAFAAAAALLALSAVKRNDASDYAAPPLPPSAAFAAFIGENVLIGATGSRSVYAYAPDGRKLWSRELDETVVGLYAAAEGAAAARRDNRIEFIDGEGLTRAVLDLGVPVKALAYDAKARRMAIAASVTSSANYVCVLENISALSDIADTSWYLTAKATPAGVGIDPETGAVYYAAYTGNLYLCTRTDAGGADTAVFQSEHLLNSFLVTDDGAFVFGAQNGNLNLHRRGADGGFSPLFNRKYGNFKLRLAGGAGGGFAALSDGGTLIFGETAGAAVKASKITAAASAQALARGGNGAVAVLRDGEARFYSPGKSTAAAAFAVVFPIALACAALSGGAAAVFGVSLRGGAGDAVGKWARDAFRGARRAKKQYLMLLPAFAFLAVFIYVPVVRGFAIAFQRFEGGMFVEWVGFANFVKVFGNAYFIRSLGNMGIFLATDLLKALIVPVFVAEVIVCLRSKRSQYAARVLMYIPGVLPGVAAMLLWRFGIYGQNGILNQLFGALGIKSLAAADFLGDPNYALGSIIMIGFPWVGGYIIVYGALMGVPESLHEAARLDGCGRFRRVFVIDLPMIFAQIKYLFITAFIGSMQDFNRVYLTTEGGPGQATYVPALELFFNINRFHDYGAAAAMGILLFIVIFTGSMLLMNIKKEKGGAAAV
ncbi:MAG: sugar ABC transporter permease [Clostridiales bacterium]|jgi:ABC-type sugar transport system permease subunit|nr:sugar ABC transporter permease [Clostridiales bacterium]